MDCLFCKILCGDIPAHKFYEDDQVIAFHDISAQAPVHFLVIPKKHIATLNDLSEENDKLLAGHIPLHRPEAGARTRLPGRLPRGDELQRPRRPDRPSHSHARTRAATDALAAGLSYHSSPCSPSNLLAV